MSQLKPVSLAIAAVAAMTVGLASSPDAFAGTALGIRIEGVLAGANGDSRVQFVEILMEDNAQQLWGPQMLETEPRTILTFHDATGLQVGTFEFPSDAPISGVADADGHYSVLIATNEFENATGGIVPDFTMPPSLVSVDGMVCFRENPANTVGEPVNLCLSYGNYIGALEADGCMPSSDNGTPEIGSELPIANDMLVSATVMGLVRSANNAQSVSFGCYESGGGNSDFSVAAIVARNNAGDTAGLVTASDFDQGQTLFEDETFYGNGRTCASCHVPGLNFALPPDEIASRFSIDPMDPLFVNEFDAGLADLENTCLMRQGNLRGLSLENVNGFDMDPGFRATPHLLNIGLTAPYGLSGDLNELEFFAVGAIEQHLPKTLARNSDPTMGALDFRVPTVFEELAMKAFQIQASEFPPPGTLAMDIGTVPNGSFTSVERDLFLDAMIQQYLVDFPAADAGNIAAGRALYFGELTGQCFRCHDGQALDTADELLGTGVDSFDVVSGSGFLTNADDGCSGGIGDPIAALPPADAGRAFNNSPMIGIARTAPFFHDSSAATLTDAVDHYTSGRFRNSPAGMLLNSTVGTDITLTVDDVDRVVDFLNAVSFVPEPSSVLMQLAAIAAIGLLRRRTR